MPLLNKLALKKYSSFSARPTIVFLHDSLGCIELWRDFPKMLGEMSNCNVMLYDRQGYGRSCGFSKDRDIDYMEVEADILIELLELQKIEQAILFGHSDGGSIALIAAGKYPDKFLGVISEAAHIFVEEVTLTGINQAVELYKTSNLKSKLQKYHGEKTGQMFSAWAATWLDHKFREWNIERFLPSIACPLLLIQGENDEYGTMAQIEGIESQAAGPTCKLIVKECGHTPHKEFPQLILDQAASFVMDILTGEFK